MKLWSAFLAGTFGKESTFKRVARGETPLDLGGGSYIAVCKDPDGNFFELIGRKAP